MSLLEQASNKLDLLTGTCVLGNVRKKTMSNALLKNGCDVNSDVVALESFDSIQFCSCDISVLPKAVVKVKFLFLLSEKPSLLLLILYVEKRSNTLSSIHYILEDPKPKS